MQWNLDERLHPSILILKILRKGKVPKRATIVTNLYDSETDKGDRKYL